MYLDAFCSLRAKALAHVNHFFVSTNLQTEVCSDTHFLKDRWEPIIRTGTKHFHWEQDHVPFLCHKFAVNGVLISFYHWEDKMLWTWNCHKINLVPRAFPLLGGEKPWEWGCHKMYPELITIKLLSPGSLLFGYHEASNPKRRCNLQYSTQIKRQVNHH